MPVHKRKAEDAVVAEVLRGSAVTHRGNTLYLGRKRLTTADNKLTHAGEAYERITEQSLSNWRPGLHIEGTKEYAFRSNGQKVLVRHRDSTGRLIVDQPSYFATHAT